jgi:hypothetical protein
MSYFFTGPIKTDKGYIANSSITNTDIDMNNKRITTVADPINPQDAVNLRSLENNIIYKSITLAGTNSVLVIPNTYGSYYVTISGVSDNLATAVFSISKSDSTTVVIGNRLSHSGTGDLELNWTASNGIYIKKNSITQDGNYILKII